MTPNRILVVDDDPQVRKVLRVSLMRHGYEVCEASNGTDALEMMRPFQPDLILLDLSMPGMSGAETCERIRLAHTTPIIVLSVLTKESDKVAMLEAGADDYLTKPFSMPELIARIRRSLRRQEGSSEVPTGFKDDDLEIDFESRRIVRRGQRVHLTPKELEVLRYLVVHADKPVPHRDLLRSVWGPDYRDDVAYLRVFINRLRNKVEPDPAAPRYILTEPWVGYVFAGQDR